MRTIFDHSFKDKKVIIRVDFNVPMSDDLKVVDTTRIKASKPTICKVLEDGGAVILMSHLGRPKGVTPELSLKNIIPTVSQIIERPIKFSNDCIGKKTEELANNLAMGEVLLLENLRFHTEEEKADRAFAKSLSKLADNYINDAFGVSHRLHASTALMAKYFPYKSYFGALLIKEIENINKVLDKPKKPVTVIIGGAKISSKIGIIENILTKVNHIIIGGAMAFTFIRALGGEIGSSRYEEDKLKLALKILKKAKQNNVDVHLPLDTIISESFDNDALHREVLIEEIPKGWMGLDIGSKTISYFKKIIEASKTILWNGPLGVFEFDNFEKGTLAIGEQITKTTANGAFSLVGGGDSVAATKKFGFENKVSYVSTGGGALLEMLKGKNLPGIVSISKST